jgi:NAD(P)H dehydrogenase (quinone)
MKILIVYAHPEPKSFNNALKDRAIQVFKEASHDVIVSDLYQMRFKCIIDEQDFTARANPEVLQIPFEQEAAQQRGTTAPDIAAEQEKLLWADLVLFQFPLWLYSQPAILKGWMERVFSSGFAHEVKSQSEGRRWFENGGLRGKRAMLSLTCAGADSAYEPTGRHGDINRILWPIHNALRYSGFDVIPPFVSYAVLRGGDPRRQQLLCDFEKRLKAVWNTPPLPFHRLTEYDEAHQLLDNIAPVTAGQWRPS